MARLLPLGLLTAAAALLVAGPAVTLPGFGLIRRIAGRRNAPTAPMPSAMWLPSAVPLPRGELQWREATAVATEEFLKEVKSETRASASKKSTKVEPPAKAEPLGSASKGSEILGKEAATSFATKLQQAAAERRAAVDSKGTTGVDVKTPFASKLEPATVESKAITGADAKAPVAAKPEPAMVESKATAGVDVKNPVAAKPKPAAIESKGTGSGGVKVAAPTPEHSTPSAASAPAPEIGGSPAASPKVTESSGGDSAAEESWSMPFMPLAAAGAAVLALIAGITIGMQLRDSSPAPRAPAALPAPAPVVVQMQRATPPAPAVPAPVSPPAPAPAAPAPSAVPAPPPAASLPAAPAPAVVLAAAPSASKAAPPAPEAAAEDFGWVRKAAGFTSSGLRAAADWLPQAEKSLEAQAPAIEGDLRKVTSGKAEEALPVVGRAVSTGAEVVTRTGLQVFSAGLNVAADNLPAAGSVLQTAIDKAMPAVTSGTHAAASATHALAAKLATPGAVQLPANTPEAARQAVAMAPMILDGAASGLDMLADAAPGVEKAVAYAADKVMPIAQATLHTTANFSQDASGAQVQLPEPAKVNASLKAVGVDTERIAAQAGDMARQAAEKAVAKLPPLPVILQDPPAPAATPVSAAAPEPAPVPALAAAAATAAP